MARPRRLLFGEDAQLYDRARPTYPEELFDDLVQFAGGPGRALDAACGTGKVTVGLAARGFGGVGTPEVQRELLDRSRALSSDTAASTCITPSAGSTRCSASSHATVPAC